MSPFMVSGRQFVFKYFYMSILNAILIEFCFLFQLYFISNIMFDKNMEV